MKRRSFLSLGAASLVGTIPILRRKDSSPMQVSATAPPGGPAAPSEEERIDAKITRQMASFTERTHSPCYRRCMEARMDREAAAQDALEDGFERGDRTAAVVRYRRALTASTAEFQACIGGCP
jgi:hypothetical protein